MFRKVTFLIVFLGLLFILSGCGLRERLPGERPLPDDGIEDEPGGNEAGSDGNGSLPGEEGEDCLLLEELEREIDELLNILDELDELEESDLNFE